jgi:uncharacterized protein with HEPN domain
MSRAHPQRVTDYLGHISQAIARIQDYTASMTIDSFMGDQKTCDAVIRNLEIVGEACNNVTKHHPEFATQHPEIPWGFAYEMRNALAHGYFTVDLTIVWQTLQNDLPTLKVQLDSIAPE